MIELKNVSKRFGAYALHVNLQLAGGQIVGLAGANGAGKTTLIEIMLGLTQPDAGEVNVFGKPVAELTNPERLSIGTALMDGDLAPDLTIRKLAKLLAMTYPRFDAHLYHQECAWAQMPLNMVIRKLSTGQRAYLRAIVALTHNAQLVVLDEPTAGLDVARRTHLHQLLQAYLDADETRLVVLSSQVGGDLEQICDTALFINRGAIALQLNASDALDDCGLVRVTEAQLAALHEWPWLMRRTEHAATELLVYNRTELLRAFPELLVTRPTLDGVLLMLINGGIINERNVD